MKRAAIFMCLALAGCASNTPQGWQKPGASAAATSQDFAECNYEAKKHTPPTQVAGDIAGDALRIRSLRNECLTIRGYRERP